MLHGRGAGRRTAPPLPGPETEQTTAREKREKSGEKIRGSYRKLDNETKQTKKALSSSNHKQEQNSFICFPQPGK